MRRLPLVALLGLGLAASGCRTLRAARILRAAQRPAHELMEGVRESARLVGDTPVLLYRPAAGSGPWPALVLCHGAVDAGARDPRLVALARALARERMLVACPDLRSLGAFRVDPQDVERLVLVADWVEARPESGRLSLVGISIGGSYGLLAASAPALHERLAAVLALGPYEDLERLLTTWLVAPVEGLEELYDPLVEGRRRVLLGNLEGLAPARDRAALRVALVALLRGEALDDGPARGLSAAGRRLLGCARSTEPVDRATAEAVLAPLLPDLRALSPGRQAAVPTARVFLLHGAGDPIVPPDESARLASGYERAGVRVRAHVSRALAHVATGERPALLQAWALARFVAAFLAAAGA